MENQVNAKEVTADVSQESEQVEKQDGGQPAETSKKKGWVLPAVAAAVVVIAIVLSVKILVPILNYNAGEKAFAEKNYELAEQKYSAAGDYKDSAEKAILSAKADHYQKAEALFNSSQYAESAEEYALADDYKDAKLKSEEAIKADHYVKAEKLFDDEKYAESVEEFILAGNYQDAEERADEAANADHYQQAETLLEEKKYEKALEQYTLSNGYKESADRIKECSYYVGVEKIEANLYEDAIALLKDAGDFQDAAAKLTEANYKQGEKLFLNKDYFAAAEYLQTASDNGISTGLLEINKGEAALCFGNVSEALDHYNNAPAEFSIEGFDVQGRRNAINNCMQFMGIAGVWKATKNYIEVKNIWNYDGRWDSWYIDEADASQTLDIKCVINDDNTITVSGRVYFFAFNNFSSLSRLCVAHMTSRSFEWQNPASIPATTDLGDNATLKYSNGVFSLSYSKRDDYSVNFHNVYSSSVTYGAKK